MSKATPWSLPSQTHGTAPVQRTACTPTAELSCRGGTLHLHTALWLLSQTGSTQAHHNRLPKPVQNPQVFPAIHYGPRRSGTCGSTRAGWQRPGRVAARCFQLSKPTCGIWCPFCTHTAPPLHNRPPCPAAGSVGLGHAAATPVPVPPHLPAPTRSRGHFSLLLHLSFAVCMCWGLIQPLPQPGTVLTKPNSSHCSPAPGVVATDGCCECRGAAAGSEQEGSTRLPGATRSQPSDGLSSSPVSQHPGGMGTQPRAGDVGG